MAIITEGLIKRYGRVEALRGLDLQVQSGVITGFLGPNGAGKSTTLRLLLGLVRPTAGRLWLQGQAVRGQGPPAAAQVGALVEGPAFVEYLSARDNLRMLAALAGGVSREWLDEVLALVGLADRQHDAVRGFSHGMKQRLGLAQALCPRPRLLILDEPASGLDPEGLAEMRQLLCRLRDEQGMTIFLSSHLLHEVQLTCDEVAVVQGGRLVAAGPVGELLAPHQGRVRVGVSDPVRADEIAAALPYVTAVSRAGDDELVVSLPPEQVAGLNAALVGAGLSVWRLQPLQPDLERFYLELMGHHAPGN